MQAQRSHRAFLDAVEPPAAMLSLVDVRQLLKRGETAESWFPEGTSAIVTSTVSDDKLNLISWERERDIVRAFKPAYHIPTDAGVYDEQSSKQRRMNTTQCMEGTLWMADQLADANITLLPLIKGMWPSEREICYRVFDRINAEQCVFYGVQYITGGAGLNRLREDVEAIASETALSILVVGLLSPLYLGRLPDQVVAAAGLNQWLTRVAPREHSPAAMRHRYWLFAEEVGTALGHAGSHGGR